ncbi:MAG TPA: glycosyltransferase family 2 protein [Acidisarcina sp.]|nr:glycosyltransferase family 2 protein [Acidisarcina sp.]
MRKTISVAIITKNEEANLARTLESVRWADERIVVDSGSTDHTVEIARDHGAKVFLEEWKGFAGQKNSAIAKCTGELVLSLDADEEVSAELATEIQAMLSGDAPGRAYSVPRRNHFLGRWIRYGGYFPDRKLRLFPRGACVFEERTVHESMQLAGNIALDASSLQGSLYHHSYPTLEDYIEHMNRYSSLGAEMASSAGKASRSLPAFVNHVLLNPAATFAYNYLFRLGFLDGREGLLLHLYHSAYISWKYAKAWQISRKSGSDSA